MSPALSRARPEVEKVTWDSLPSGRHGAENAVVGALGEIDKLPVGGELGGEIADRDRLDQDAERPLVELLGKAEFAKAPLRLEPGAAHQEEDGLAAVGGLMQPPFPALAGGDAARRVEVEEEIVPALGDQPVAKGRRPPGCCGSNG